MMFYGGNTIMSDKEIEKIIFAVSKELENAYDRNKTEHYGLADRTLIPFATIRSTSRVVRSEGTDEDNDVMICYNENGWFIYDITVQVGAGIEKVIKESDTEIGEREVFEKYQELDLIEKMNFISTAYKILNFSSNVAHLFWSL